MSAPVSLVPDGDDADTLDDQAAELDDDAADPDDSDTLTDDDTGDTSDDISGLCLGGPYDGRTMTSRFPKGFLLADRIAGTAYLYDYAAGMFTCRDPHGTPLDTDKRWLAAEQDTYDVIAYDAEVHP